MSVRELHKRKNRKVSNLNTDITYRHKVLDMNEILSNFKNEILSHNKMLLTKSFKSFSVRKDRIT